MRPRLVDALVTLLLVILFLAVIAQIYIYNFTTAWLEGMRGPFYGNWMVALFSVTLLSIFFLAFLKPLQERNWRQFGMTEAYIVALFTEMFGIPLTIYLLTSVAGYNIGLSGLEGHLWATLLARLGILRLSSGVALVMVISMVLIGTGLVLMAAGWKEIYYSEGGLVVEGLYSKMRHPQYTGFFLLITGFLIQWPTIVTLLMFPFLIYMYYRLAKKEEAEMIGRFGDRYLEYMKRTRMFLPAIELPPTYRPHHP